jgi:RNA polymerase sigma-70 factor (ECF subfamily)
MFVVTQDVQPDSVSSFVDPDFLQELRVQMIKFANLQLGDVSLAEDAVQEAMLAALKGLSAFGRESAIKTWVFAILKHKITDILRKNSRHVSLSALETEQDDFLDTFFADNGHWHLDARPKKWTQPDDHLENSHFWRVFDLCLNGMPNQYARLFMMREFLELETDEICRNEAITENSLNVSLYRARLRLRACLEHHWYQQESKNGL